MSKIFWLLSDIFFKLAKMLFAFIAASIIAILIYKLVFSNSTKNFWKQHGIYEIDVSSAVSNLDLLLNRKSLFDADDFVYEKLGNEKFCGIIQQGKPVIVLKDVELIKKVLIKDFDHFMDRRRFFAEADGCLNDVLFNLEGDVWKNVRASVSPTFTSGKIRGMMDLFNSVAKDWAEELRKQAKNNPKGNVEIDVMSNVNRYTVDAIASTVFGFNAGTVKDKDSQFLKMANVLSDITTFKIIKFAMRFQFPRLSALLGLKIVDTNSLEFFENILTQGLKQRMNGEMKRNDFLQLLVQAKKGELKSAGADELNTFEKEAEIKVDSSSIKKQYLTDEIMIAQCVAFFFAGFSTTSNFITFVMYALAVNREVQEKLREEVKGIVRPDGTFDYDDLGKLPYLDMVTSETNRKFAAAGRLERVCVREYRDLESGLVIPKGTTVVIPLNAMHHDGKYYDKPNEFYPEHFSPDKKASRNPYTYMPFGIGPRNCIGMRLALVQGKAALAHIVLNFKIEPTNKTPIPMAAKPAGLQFMPPDGLELRLTPIK